MPDLETARESLQKAREWMRTTYPQVPGRMPFGLCYGNCTTQSKRSPRTSPRPRLGSLTPSLTQFKVGDRVRIGPKPFYHNCQDVVYRVRTLIACRGRNR